MSLDLYVMVTLSPDELRDGCTRVVRVPREVNGSTKPREEDIRFTTPPNFTVDTTLRIPGKGNEDGTGTVGDLLIMAKAASAAEAWLTSAKMGLVAIAIGLWLLGWTIFSARASIGKPVVEISPEGFVGGYLAIVIGLAMCKWDVEDWAGIDLSKMPRLRVFAVVAAAAIVIGGGMFSTWMLVDYLSHYGYVPQ